MFFVPVLVTNRPFAALGGLVVAHGLQYLVLMGMVAARSPRSRRGAHPALVLAGVAMSVGAALHLASHLQRTSAVTNAIYGAYLGAVMAHFVIDAGFWRLRDEFPRRFLSTRLPELVAPRDVHPVRADISAHELGS